MINRLDDLDVTFDHLIDMPNSDCVFCSTRVKENNRIKLFLIFNERNAVYIRNGLSGIWEEIFDAEKINFIRSRFEDVIEERKVPCYAITE